MGKPRSFEVCCLNIRVHTKHEPYEYAQLWRALARARTPYVWPSSLALMIGEARHRENDPADGFYGDFYRFIQLDKDSSWFNIQDHKPAEDSDLARISIPANLQPNLRAVPYYFDIRRHRLYFVRRAGTTSVSGGQVERLLLALTARDEILQRFGTVEIQVITEVEAVDELLRWPVLRTLEITLERPNPTDFDDEAAVFERLNKFGARRERRDYQLAEGVKTLTPDAETKALAAVAASNGRVFVKGIDGKGESRAADSRSFPWRKKVHYNPDLQTFTDAFLELVRNLFPRRKL